jgi:L-alanine-DL-glutamate epimerase-like enolase superfamily enzyme
VTLCPHWFHDVHAPLVAATPNARLVELFTDDKVLNFRRLITPQLSFKGGMIELSERPGLGCDFLNEAVERYAVEPWT